jgi:hypothetical protein
MKRLIFIVVVFFCPIADYSEVNHLQRQIGKVGPGADFLAIQQHGKWGLQVSGAGMASVVQPKPVSVELYQSPDKIVERTTSYDDLDIHLRTAIGRSVVRYLNVSFIVEDRWRIEGEVLRLTRKVTVRGTADAGFLTAITFNHHEKSPRSAVDYFAPGMIYGSPDHLSAAAIGGSDTYGPSGHGNVQIREDRLPAPMFGVHFADGSAFTVLDPSPQGGTTREDSHDTVVKTMVDSRFSFGAVGVHLADGQQEQGFWFPGTEGEVTYRGDTYPGGQLHQWRRRYHPIKDGFTQKYSVDFRFTAGEAFPAYYRQAWRWAFDVLKPPVVWQDIPVIQRSIVDLLANKVETIGDRSGIPNFVMASGSDTSPDRRAIMGFTGKNLESAEMLLADAQSDHDAVRATHDRELGIAILNSFLRLRMNPPIGEGFDINTGEPRLAIDRDHRVYLRSFGDDMKAIMRAYRREKAHGQQHPDWLAWTSQFADWLLSQQQAGGGFPRAWKPETGEVADASPASSYNPIPFLMILSQETSDHKYLEAAERAGEFAWTNGQSKGQFVGGTIDNPDVLDKEAGTLSNEAYLALYSATHEKKWLDRARGAADYAETFIYLWNVPMPPDDDNAQLQWKMGVPTYGTQLIATGHSLVDDYMAFDVDEYARLAVWSGDDHYMEVAKLLLFDTKEMIAVPGRTFDLKGTGWQQEHWSFAPVRGFGLHRGWLPWVATSQLKGIIGLREFDPKLFLTLTGPHANGGR